jgi:hypothetical protein
MTGSAGSRGLVRAGKLWSELEALGARFMAIRDCLLVTAPINAITPAIRDRMAEQREELLSLVEEAGPRSLSVAGAELRRKPVDPVFAAHFAAHPPLKPYEITGVQTLHGTVVVTLTSSLTSKDPHGVFTFTYDLLVPADKYDEAALREVFQQVVDTPIH